MGDPYKPLPAGAAVTGMSRTAYNLMLRMLREWRQGGGRGANRSSRTVCEVLVCNRTYLTAPAFSILGIDEPLISPFKNRFACQQRPGFNGVEPTVDNHLGKWVVLEEPIGAGKIGKAVLVGFAVVRLYVNAADDEYCDVIDAETIGGEKVYLGSGPSGARILWRENAGSGEDTICWACICLPCIKPATCPRFYIGTTTGAVTAGTGFHVSGLTATDGGSVPDPDHTGPDTWDVENAAAGGDGYDIDASKVGKIIGYADGTLHPLDFPCPA
jgi:hypothetical protein